MMKNAGNTFTSFFVSRVVVTNKYLQIAISTATAIPCGWWDRY